MFYTNEYKSKAAVLRKKGFSIKEIAKILNVSVSTSSLWCSKTQIGKRAQKLLAKKLRLSLIHANQTLNKKRRLLDEHYTMNAKNELSTIHFTKPLYKLLCAIFIWTEGGKSDKYRVSFTNSDPAMIQTFLTLLRASFEIDEHKLRALIHVHEYHDEKQVKMFWSLISKIPINQFTKSFHKANTKKRIRIDYKGSMHVTYYDTKVAHELRKLYNTFAQQIVSSLEK